MTALWLLTSPAVSRFWSQAAISDRFADIFRNNSLKNGLLPITVEKHFLEYLLGQADQAVRIDIHQRKLVIEGYGECEFPLDPFSAYCITRGIDQLDFILDHEQDISTYEQQNDK
jgi:3-isopropylmalate/(R)-2-methylmalate dehydratase small subunit